MEYVEILALSIGCDEERASWIKAHVGDWAVSVRDEMGHCSGIS